MNMSSRPSRLVWWFGLLLLIGTAVGTSWLMNPSSANDGSTEKVQVSPPFGAAGGIIAFGHADVEQGVANLSPVQLGRVTWIEKENQVVAKGKPLVKVDDRLAKLQLDEAKGALENARQLALEASRTPLMHTKKVEQQRAAIRAAEKQHEAAKFEQAIKEKLFRDKQISDDELKGVQASVAKVGALIDVEKAKLQELQALNVEAAEKRAQADVAAKEAKVKQAELALEECTLLAPYEGLVLRTHTNVGEVLSGNSKLPAVQLCPKTKRIVRAEVQQEWASRVKVGQDCVIEDDTTSAQQWKGKVYRISDWYTHRRSILMEPFQYNDVRTLECLVEVVEQPDKPLRIGQRMRVTIRQGGP